MKQSHNELAVQSRKWFMEAMIDLMNCKTFQEITISELSTHADLGRRTFYRNFTSKEDVIESYLDLLIAEFINRLIRQEVLTAKYCLMQLFTLCSNNKAFLVGLNNSNMLPFLLHKWNLSLPYIHTLMSEKIPNFPNQDSENSLGYALAFNAGGVWNVTAKWVSSGMVESPKELTLIIMKMVRFSNVKIARK
jgi:AcrR family transcriptional regulator